MQRIYLDNNATTALDPKVFKAMLVDLQGPPSNPSSVHSFGREARAHLQKARQTVASFFQGKPEEMIFTSGGTESINLFLRGLGKKGHIITTAIEHSAIYKTIQSIESQGLRVTYLLDLAGIAVSHGSACASGSMEPSRVLTQMGLPKKITCSSLRFSVGRMNTREEIDLAIEKTAAIVKKLI